MNDVDKNHKRLIREVAIYKIGVKISNIINQDGDDVSDSKVVDQIVQYLKRMNIYKPRK